MNKLKLEVQAKVIGALVEGCSIRSVERMTGIHRDTIMRTMVRIGEGCERMMDEKMRGLTCHKIQVDELWCYVGKKQRWVNETDDAQAVGDQWTFIAMDAETKLVPSYRVGKRTLAEARLFMKDLASRLDNRCQISSDGFRAYVDACDSAFGRNNVDFGQIVKSYEAEGIGPGRYSPPKVASVDRKAVFGNPDYFHISTSHVERLNLSVRMGMRRYTRLTNAFSKKLPNLKAAVGLHFAHYNFVRTHSSLRVTPAMEAGISNRVWTLEEIAALAQ